MDTYGSGTPSTDRYACGVFFAPFWGTLTTVNTLISPDGVYMHRYFLTWTTDVYHAKVFEKAFEALSGWKSTVL